MHLSSSEWELLEKELNEVAPICSFCHFSEQITMCDILIDSKCKKDICQKCYQQYQKQSCEKCTLKIAEHHRKQRNTFHEKNLEEASKMYNREMKARSNELWENLDPDLINALVYFFQHPNATARKKFQDYQKEIKRIVIGQRKGKNMIYAENQKKMMAKHKGFDTYPDQDGREASGYQSNFRKGLALIYKSFSFQ